MQDNYLVKRKNSEGILRIFGNVKKNQWGNYSLGMKVTPELRELVNQTKEGDWLNFSLYSASDDEKKPQKRQTDPTPTDEIPW